MDGGVMKVIVCCCDTTENFTVNSVKTQFLFIFFLNAFIYQEEDEV